jgi:3D (Asp-Asp-Asp) domain-containing protein
MKWIITAYFAFTSTSRFADGNPAIWKSDTCVVAAPAAIPFGTKYKVYFDTGTKICVVRDHIGKPQSTTHLDIFMRSREAAIQFGKQILKVEKL